MKDTRIKLTGKRTILYVLLSILFLPTYVVLAKQNDSLTGEPAVYSGRLENGFTYFIKPLETSGEAVQMELFIKSGYQRQKEGESDMAHFLEHLPISQFHNKAYRNNGRIARALRDKKLVLNGSTNYDHTRYTFSYPRGDSYLRDTGLNYFSEIALGSLQLNPYILNTEKAMFYEEIINRGEWESYNIKMVNPALADCFIKPIRPDSLWNHIKKFNINRLQGFYDNWYQPELSSLVIVGPIGDIEGLESKIKQIFSSSGTKTTSLESECPQKFLKSSPRFVILNSEHNLSNNRKELIFHSIIRDNKEIKDLSAAQWEWIKPALSQSINKFLWRKQGSYNKSYTSNATWHRVLPALDIRLSTEMGQVAQALKETYALLKEIKQNGISHEQWTEIKNNKIQELKNKDVTSMNYWMYKLRKQALFGKEASTEGNLINWWTELSVRNFNAILREFIPDTPDDIVALVPLTPQEDEDYWRSNIKIWLDSSTAEVAHTPFFEIDSLEFDDELERKGYKELSRDIFGARVFELSNGLQVILKEIPKPSEKEGSITIHGFRIKGGLHFSEEGYYNAMLSPFVIRNAGVGNLDKFQLQNVLSGTSISRIYPYVTDTESGIKGRSGEKDLEMFFQIIYKYIVAPRVDSLAFRDWQSQEWENFLHPKGDNKANSDFKDKIGEKLNIPAVNLSVSERYRAVLEIEMNEAYQIYQSIFNQASDFTFLISSSVEAEKLLPLLDKYLGNLPNVSQGNNIKTFKGVGKLPAGPINEILEIPSIPYKNVLLSVQYLKAVELSDWKTRIHLKILAEVLSTRIKQLRDVKRRGIYDSSISYSPNDEVNLPGITITIPTIRFQCNLILEDIQDIILELFQKPLEKEELNAIVQQKILPEYRIESKQNISKSLENLYNYYRLEVLPPNGLIAQEYISSLTPEVITDFARQFFTEENKYVFIGKPDVK